MQSFFYYASKRFHRLEWIAGVPMGSCIASRHRGRVEGSLTAFISSQSLKRGLSNGSYCGVKVQRWRPEPLSDVYRSTRVPSRTVLR
jgi:hypothetical protein